MATFAQVDSLQKRLVVQMAQFGEAAVSDEDYGFARQCSQNKRFTLLARKDVFSISTTAIKRLIVTQTLFPSDTQLRSSQSDSKLLDDQILVLKDCLPQKAKQQVGIEEADMKARMERLPPLRDPKEVGAQTFKEELARRGNAMIEAAKKLPGEVVGAAGQAVGGGIAALLTPLLPFILIGIGVLLLIVFLLRGQLGGIVRSLRPG